MNYATIFVNDGKYNKSFARLLIKRNSGQVIISIKYGNFENFLPVSVLKTSDNKISLSAAYVGSIHDIVISFKEWFRVLKTLGANEMITYWETQIKSHEELQGSSCNNRKSYKDRIT